jgi:hypothetical protein
MLIHSGIVKLDYNPSTDVLETCMPDIRQFGLSEVSFCLELIVDSIKNYDIKYLLLDSSKSVIEVDDEAYKAIITKLALDLMNSHLKKIARIGTKDTQREEKAAKVATELRLELNLPIDYKSFNSKAEALDWLLAPGK